MSVLISSWLGTLGEDDLKVSAGFSDAGMDGWLDEGAGEEGIVADVSVNAGCKGVPDTGGVAVIVVSWTLPESISGWGSC